MQHLLRFASLTVLSMAALLSFAACSASGDATQQSSMGSGANGSGGGSGTGFQPSGSGGNGEFNGEKCGEQTFANAVPGNVLLVLDRSGSMSGGDGEPDKWAPTKSAIQYMMNTAEADLAMGLLPFPAGNFNDAQLAACFLQPGSPQCAALFADGGCEDVFNAPVVPIAPLSQSKQPINGWLSSHGPTGNTPTYHALEKAYDILKALDTEGERYALLLTDGEPTTHTPPINMGPLHIPESNIECKKLADIEAAALDAATSDPPVKTFVIGSPGSEGAGAFLSRLAINGDTRRSDTCTPGAANCHYQIGAANFQADLEEALETIAGAVTDCYFAIPDGNVDVDPNRVNVVVETANGKLELKRDPSHQDGWDYTDESHTHIRLYGPACEAYKAEKGAKTTIVLGCKTVVK
jgi:hypothetical protein